MKRIIILTGISLVILFGGAIFTVHILNGRKVKENIAMVKQQYPGTAEDALIAYLLDENNPSRERTHTAIWTLGQIKSEKALPVLAKFDLNDSEGKTCKGKHDSLLCLYEIHKAIVHIRRKWYLSHAKLNV